MESEILSFDEFTGLSVAGLEAYDILTLNFHAAKGLPGTDNSNLEAWLNRRDDWVARIKVEICRHVYRLERQSSYPPTEFSYGNSLGRFFCWYMLQVLQEDCGVRYHPDRKFKPDSCKPRDVFAHGIMDDDGEGGTCSSMPVVYVSVARALGLPVFLVETRGHAFFRWDDPKGTAIRWQNPDLVLWIPPDRFNVEGSGEGIAYHDDSYYVKWPEVWTEIDILHGRYLRSMNPKEELAGFLIERGECFWDLGNRIEALNSYHYTCQLVPGDERYKQLRAVRCRAWEDWEARNKAIDEEVRQSQKRLSGSIDHPATCLCNQCRRNRSSARQFPDHGPSCQCLSCKTERQEAKRPRGMPGHPSTCLCSGCLHRRHVAVPVGL